VDWHRRAILNDVHVMVGHAFEHHAAIWKLRHIANSGELGEIR
jgi:predicted dehydrogenase